MVEVAHRGSGEPENAWLAAIVDSADDAIISVGPDLTITSWNTGAERLYGYSADEMIGRLGRVLVPPSRSYEEGVAMEVFRGERRVAHFQTQRVRKDGTLIDVSVTATPVVDATGEVIGVSGIVRDISQTHRDERGMQESEARVRAVFEAAPDALVVADQTGLIQLVNRRVEELFGYHRGELVGQPIEVLVPERVRLEHPRLRARFAEDPHTRQMGPRLNLTGCRRDGSEFPVEVALSPVQSEDGLLVTAAVRDVTDRHTQQVERDRRATVLGKLSTREFEVLELLCDGLSAPEIAAGLHLSPRTVESHLASAYRKLDVNSRDQAVETLRQLTA